VNSPAASCESALDERRSVSIQIVLATHNSEVFLPALLDSLFAQTRQDFTLLVSDDASSDRTQAILEAFANRYPGRIAMLSAGIGRRGIIANFDRLLTCATADYVFLSDHDDVWLPDKIERSLAAMHTLEARHGPNVPLLIHTDLIVTGPELEVQAESFFDHGKIDPRRNDLAQLLLANVVTGCTAVVNRALREQACPIPQDSMMHDHWLALVAATTGVIAVVDAPTILYRQHDANAIGADTPSFLERVYGTLVSDERQRVMKRYSRQAAALLARFGSRMNPRHRVATETLARLWDMPRHIRFSRLRRSGLGLRGIVRNVALLIVVTRPAARREPSRRHAGSDRANDIALRS
jgi:glycosyltransferase involved in cell wall biosynthesis